MPRKEVARPCKKLLSKGPQKRHEEIRSENSEDRQAGLETIGERRAKETEHHFQLGLERNHSCQTRRQPAFVIKEEPIEFDPEPSTSAEFIIQNANDDAFHVEPALVIREQPIQFDPQPSASADIVLKDEFVVSSEDYTGSSAVVPPSTEPTSHVTLSVARLGSSQQPDNDQ
ncbi:hypothetical protein CDAR_470681 [Caerostris darwini]|uniref:Uncharacterized protein n=1 Tax=Caerostris darwini TaxID=1538125 RepID=A0AAV4VG87_9ARAC|nr:hypothetical protein CDAR_470681 [Caerostris darwini]